ncbi:MAG: helix-turn-helix transcriptional regulator [Kiritimatiellae bacterium]|nr:helix-turn-helix transcriptional regulator [Kiritimatiellia bacterium]
MKQTVQPLHINRMNVPVTPDEPIIAFCTKYLHPQKRLIYDMHFALELGIVLRGRMERRCRQRKEILKPGQIWLCGVWEPHGWAILETPCEVAVFVIRPAALMEMACPEAPHFDWLAPFIANIKDRPRIHDFLRRPVIALGKRMAAAVKAQNAQDAAKNPEIRERARLKLRVCLMETLLMLTEKWRPPSGNPRPSTLYDRINRVVELVFHQRRFITAAEAAKACGMAYDSFCEAFREVMGLNFGDFVMSNRMDGARNQLLATPDPIKKIAADWGFVDHSHFHHAFLRHYGCKPSVYRKQILGNNRRQNDSG